MKSRRLLALCLGLGGVLGAAGFLATAEPVLGLAIFVVFLLAYFMWTAQVRTTYLALMFLGLVVESPPERPYAGEWHPPWEMLGHLLFTNLHHHTHIPILRVSGMELGLLCLVALVMVRKAWHLDVDPPAPRSPTPLRQALLLGFFALVWLEVWGVARGGDVKQSLFQMREMLFTVLVAYLGLYALRGARDVMVVGRVLVAAAVVRTGLGAFFFYAVARPAGLIPPYVTTHTDTVLFCLALMVLVTRWWEAPSLRRLFEVAGLGAIVFFGVYLNDRRLAWVTLAGCLALVYLVSPWNRARRFVTRGALLMMPLLVAYVVVGWNSTSTLFRPVAQIHSMVAPESGGDSEEDSSTEFRFLENFNVVQTWRQNPVLGSGFGHEYIEVAPLPDISMFMPDYRFQPHNEVLFLWAIGGLLGYSAMFLYLAVAMFLGARAYHAAVRPAERAMMLVGMSAVVAYLNQVYGDMGQASYTSAMTLAPLVALVGQVAMSSGGWREAPRATLSAGGAA